MTTVPLVVGSELDLKVIWDCEGTARVTQYDPTEPKIHGRMSLLLFLTHYIRYYNLKPADVRVASYRDNTSPLKAEGRLPHRKWTRQVGAPKMNHDVIMTLLSR
jgi:hypothetical protein